MPNSASPPRKPGSACRSKPRPVAGRRRTQRLPRASDRKSSVKMIVAAIRSARLRRSRTPDRRDRRWAGRRLAKRLPARWWPRSGRCGKLRDGRQQARSGEKPIARSSPMRSPPDQEGTRAGGAVRRRRRGRRRDRAAVRRRAEEGAGKASLKLMAGTSPRRSAHAFFSEREAAKIAGVPEGTKRAMSSVSIIGAGPWAAASRCRLPMPAFRHPDRDRRGAAQARHGRDAEELRGDRGARRHSRGCAAKRMGLITGVVVRERQGC